MIPSCSNFTSHPLNGVPFQRTTVLTRAICGEAPKRTRYLLEKGCDPNGTAGKNQARPLMVACRVADDQKRLSIVRILIEHGADPTLMDVQGRSSVMYACALGLKGVTELLVKDCDYDLNATDKHGDTVLHVCAKAGSTQVLGVVLKEMQRHRLNISIQNNDYLTPLSLAILNRHYECAKIIYEAGGCPRYQKSQFDKLFSKICYGREHVQKPEVSTVPTAWSDGRPLESIQEMSSVDSSSVELPALALQPARGDQEKLSFARPATTSMDRMVRPATSMDCINALLSSPVCRTRMMSSFSYSSKSFVRMDSEWLSAITSYRHRVSLMFEEVPKVSSRITFKTNSQSGISSLTSSSASSSRTGSHSQLRLLKRAVTSPRLSKLPNKSQIQKDADKTV